MNNILRQGYRVLPVLPCNACGMSTTSVHWNEEDNELYPFCQNCDPRKWMEKNPGKAKHIGDHAPARVTQFACGHFSWTGQKGVMLPLENPQDPEGSKRWKHMGMFCEPCAERLIKGFPEEAGAGVD